MQEVPGEGQQTSGQRQPVPPESPPLELAIESYQQYRSALEMRRTAVEAGTPFRWQRFTEEGRRILLAAQQEAAWAGSPELMAEHVLLALVRPPETLAAVLLARMGIESPRIRAALKEQMDAYAVPTGGDSANGERTLPDAPLRHALDRAYGAARQWSTGAAFIHTHHLLFGLLAEPTNLARMTLALLGLDVPAARDALRGYLAVEAQASQNRAGDTSADDLRVRYRRLVVAERVAGGSDYREIARFLQIPVEAVVEDVRAIVTEWRREQVLEPDT